MGIYIKTWSNTNVWFPNAFLLIFNDDDDDDVVVSVTYALKRTIVCISL